MNDSEVEQCSEALEDTAGHSTDILDTETSVGAALQYVIQVRTKQLEGDADVLTKHKVLENVHHIEGVVPVLK